MKSDFNSHAHVERDVAEGASSDTQKISTHTLTWSVTADRGKITPEQYISTHTLTWSVTRGTDLSDFGILYFNSHAHVERDEAARPLLLQTWYFNSHAHVERDTNAY